MLILYLYLVLFVTIYGTYGEGLCTCAEPDSSFATGINLTYYTCNGESPGTISFPIQQPEGLLNVMDNRRVIIYIFGYLQTPKDSNVQMIMNALCHGRTDNVVLLDWSQYSAGAYISVFPNAEKVGTLFARSIKLLVNGGLDVGKIYIVGHSLGAHIAGFVGKCNDFAVPRITGLDPANALFYPAGCYLTRYDAQMVDIIHTDRGKYGTPIDMGTADYDANLGIRIQPGCGLTIPILSKDDFCSHQMSVKFYAESKYNPDKFIATRYSSLFSSIFGYYNEMGTRVGYAATNVTGKFYFFTEK